MSKKWIVKDVLNHVHGPYDTEEILSQIENGALTGDEFISSYPEGEWKSISTEAEFFDHMLKALSGEMDGVKDHDPLLKKTEALDPTVRLDDEDTNAKSEFPNSKSEQKKRTEPQDLDNVDEVHYDSGDSFSVADFNEDFSPINNSGPNGISGASDKKSSSDGKKVNNKVSKKSPPPPVVYRDVKGRSHLFEDRQALTIKEQAYLKKRAQQKEKTKKILYLLFALSVGLVLSLFFIEDERKVKKVPEQVLKLKLPEMDRKSLNIKNSQMKKETFQRAILLLAFDEPLKTVKGLAYLRSILKIEPRNEKALLLTCNSNFQIWPFTGETSNDLYVVSEYAKRAYSSGLTGDALSTCRVVEKILYGKYQDAMQMTDSYLNAEEASGYLSFYLRYYKAYLLHLEGEDSLAVSFAESSVKLESSWIPSLVLLSKIYLRLNRSQDAFNILTRILKINSKHLEALMLQAYLQFEYFSKPSDGFSFFGRGTEVLKGRKFYNKKIYGQTLAAIAKMYFKQGDYNQSQTYAKKAFEEDPGNVQAKNILISTGSKTNVDQADRLFMAEADQLYKEKEWKAAIALYEQAYMVNKKNGLAALRMAKAYWEQSFVKEAIRWAELAISAEPRRVQSYVTLAEFLISQYDLIAAGRVLAKAKAISKTTFEIYRGFAKIQFLKRSYPSAEKYARQALKLYSNDSETILLLAKALEEMGETEKAYARAKAAMEVTKPSFELENYYVLLLMRTRGLQMAFEYLESREAASGGNLKYQIMKANLYYADEQYEESIMVAKSVYDLLEGENIDIVKTYAKGLGALKKIETAVDQYQKAFLMKPTDPEPLFESAKLLIENNKPTSALRQLERVSQVTPKFPDLYYFWGKATQMLGSSKKSSELLLEAISLAEKEIERNPTHVDSYLLIADTYYRLGNLDRVKTEKTPTNDPEYSNIYSAMISWYKLCSKSYQKAMDLALQPGGVYIDMARCQRLSGQVDLAIASAQRAEELDSSNPRVWMETALIFEQQGNFRTALKAYETYLVVFPNAPNKDSVLKKIERLQDLSGE